MTILSKSRADRRQMKTHLGPSLACNCASSARGAAVTSCRSVTLTLPAVLAAAAETLLAEYHRVRTGHKPKRSLAQMRDLRDELGDGFHALLADYEQRRSKRAR